MCTKSCLASTTLGCRNGIFSGSTKLSSPELPRRLAISARNNPLEMLKLLLLFRTWQPCKRTLSEWSRLPSPEPNGPSPRIVEDPPANLLRGRRLDRQTPETPLGSRGIGHCPIPISRVVGAVGGRDTPELNARIFNGFEMPMVVRFPRAMRALMRST